MLTECHFEDSRSYFKPMCTILDSLSHFKYPHYSDTILKMAAAILRVFVDGRLVTPPLNPMDDIGTTAPYLWIWYLLRFPRT